MTNQYRVNLLQAFYLCQVGALALMGIFIGALMLYHYVLGVYEPLDLFLFGILSQVSGALAWYVLKMAQAYLQGRRWTADFMVVTAGIAVFALAGYTATEMSVEQWYMGRSNFGPPVEYWWPHQFDHFFYYDNWLMLAAAVGFMLCARRSLSSLSIKDVWLWGMGMTLFLNAFMLVSVYHPHVWAMWVSKLESASVGTWHRHGGARAIYEWYGPLNYLLMLFLKACFYSSFLIIVWCMTWFMLALRRWESPEPEIPGFVDSD